MIMANVGRVVGSRIYAGDATTASEIASYLQNQNIVPLVYDLFIGTNGDLWQYQAISGNNAWAKLLNLKGAPGTFAISKVYPSVSAMNAGFATDGVPMGGLVIIDTGNVDDEDNAKMYVKEESGYVYLTDLSGAKGIQGVPGEKGEPGVPGVGIVSITKTATNGLVDTYTILLSNNNTSTFTVTNGERGETGATGAPGQPGESGVTSIDVVGYTEDGNGNTDTTIRVTYAGGTTSQFIVKVKNGINGTNGQDGANGVSIAEVNSQGYADAGNGYTENNVQIVYSNASTSSVKFYAKNGENGQNGQDGTNGQDGVGIASITKTSTSGLVDTYTITLTNGNTYSFTVTNGAKGDTGATGATGVPGVAGVGITNITKTNTNGLVDTYTILYTNGNSTTFTVTNGQNGTNGQGGVSIVSATITAV